MAATAVHPARCRTTGHGHADRSQCQRGAYTTLVTVVPGSADDCLPAVDRRTDIRGVRHSRLTGVPRRNRAAQRPLLPPLPSHAALSAVVDTGSLPVVKARCAVARGNREIMLANDGALDGHVHPGWVISTSGFHHVDRRAATVLHPQGWEAGCDACAAMHTTTERTQRPDGRMLAALTELASRRYAARSTG